MRILRLASLVVAVFAIACQASPPPAAAPPTSASSPSTAVASATPALKPRSAVPTTLEPRVPEVSPTGEVRWRQIGTVPSEDSDGGPSAVFGFPGGYLAFGDRGLLYDVATPFMFSADGVRWESVARPFANGHALDANAAATDGKTMVVVGSYTPCSLSAYQQNPFGRCRERPASWTSTDGVRWRGSKAWTASIGPAEKGGSYFSGVWHVPNIGWEAAQLFSRSDESDDWMPAGPRFWASEDGQTWTKLGDGLHRLEAECQEEWDPDAFWALADARGRRIAPIECYDEGAYGLAMSTDGRAYQRLDAFSPDAAYVRPGVAQNDVAPWLLGGAVRIGNYRVAAIWSSTDVRSWSVLEMPVPAAGPIDSGVSSLGPGSTGYVAVGDASSRTDDTRMTLTWVSDDGITWRLADVQPSDALWIRGFARGPAGVLAVGEIQVSPDASTVNVWRLEDRAGD